MQRVMNLFLTVTLLASSSFPRADAGITLPDMGESSDRLLSSYEEQRLGQEFMRSVRHQATLVDDPFVEEYVQSLGYRLVAAADTRRLFNFFVVDKRTINAFAGPGGYIGVHAGLLLAAENESEVAAVLAHEIAHVTQRHLLRTFDQAQRMTLPAAAALIAALILASSSGQGGQAAIAATLASTEQNLINFTRQNEKEADRVGMQILAGADFDPRSMPAFFEKLSRQDRFAGSGTPEMLRTHPVTTSRISDTRNRAEQYAPLHTRPGNSSFLLIQARLRVRAAADPATAVKYFADALEKAYNGEQYHAARYGYALALSAAGHPRQARRQIQSLLRDAPDNIHFIAARAEIETQAGHLSQALQYYAKAMKLFPRNFPLTVAYAKALISADQAVDARRLLQDFLRYREPKPLLYKLLAQADREAGQAGDSYQALAEHAYLNGSTMMAISYLKQALELTDPTDFYRRSRIQARLGELKQEAALEMESK